MRDGEPRYPKPLAAHYEPFLSIRWFYLEQPKTMKAIPVKTEIEIDAVALCASMDIGDVVALISYAANYYADRRPGDVNDRRIMIDRIETHLSENGRRLIGEIAGCIYSRPR